MGSIERVATHRGVELRPLASVLEGYGPIGQARWAAWRRRQQLEDRLPEHFEEVVSATIELADPVIAGGARGRTWDPVSGTWQ